MSCFSRHRSSDTNFIVVGSNKLICKVNLPWGNWFRCPQGGTLVTPQWAPPCGPIGKGPWHCTSTSQYGPNKLDLEWIGCWVTDVQVSKSAYYARGHVRVAPMQRAVILHIYRPRRFQWTWFGVNPPGGCWIPASARIQEPLLRSWAHPLWSWWTNEHDDVHLQAKTVPVNLIWSESDMWLHSYGVHEVCGGRTDEWKNGRRQFHSPPFSIRKGRVQSCWGWKIRCSGSQSIKGVSILKM